MINTFIIFYNSFAIILDLYKQTVFIKLSRFTIIFFSVFIVSSCATIFNSKKVMFRVEHGAKVVIDSIPKSIYHKNNFNVAYRSPDTLKIYYHNDSCKKTFLVPAILSKGYINNFLNLGIGYLIDKNSIKKYGYRSLIIIENKNGDRDFVNYTKQKKISRRLRYRNDTIAKGTIESFASLPFFNSFYIKTNSGFYTNSGFIGLGYSLHYFYKTNNFVSLKVGVAINNEIPGPIMEHFVGTYTNMNNSHLIFSNHHLIKKFEFGYGINFANSNWVSRKTVDTNNIYFSKENYNLGLMLSAKYRFLNRFSGGVVYLPTFISFYDKSTYNYQHLISIEFSFKLFTIRKFVDKFSVTKN